MCDFNTIKLKVRTETKGFVIVSLSFRFLTVGAKEMEDLGSELNPTV